MNSQEQEKRPKGFTRREFLKAGGAAALGAAAGLVLPDSPEKARAGAPTYKVFIPNVSKEYKENPYLTREFGAPERGVIMKNRVEQGANNPAYVEMGDRELFENLMYLRETYGRPDLKLRIVFYSTRRAFSMDSGNFPSRENPYLQRGVMPWDVWARNPGIYQNGWRDWTYWEADKTLEFRIILPETLPGKIPTEDSVNKMHWDFVTFMLETFLSQEDGKRSATFQHYASGEEPEYSDFLAHTVVINADPPNIFNVSRSALWIKVG